MKKRNLIKMGTTRVSGIEANPKKTTKIKLIVKSLFERELENKRFRKLFNTQYALFKKELKQWVKKGYHTEPELNISVE